MDAVSAMSAAGHRDRARLLEALRDDVRAGGNGLSISEIAERCELDRFATSRHLGLLRRGGLVADVRLGYRRVHHLRIEAFEAIEDWAIRFSEASEKAQLAHSVTPEGDPI